MPKTAENTKHIYHVFAIRCEERENLEKYLKENEIGFNKHYPIPIHLQEAYKQLGYKDGDYPVAEHISKTEISIPLYYGLNDEEINYIIERINMF